jgi:voltage-gated potassium channel Kch
VILVSAFCVLLLVLTTTIHYEALRLLSAGLPQIAVPARTKLVVVILGTFCAHALEMFLYAVAFWVLAHYLGVGNLGTADGASFAASLYFSAETYTSLGYGDIVPSGALRLLAGMEALNGLLLIGWSASYTYLSMERLWIDEGPPVAKS